MGGECPITTFQVCGSCKRAWPTWDSFVLDSAVRLLGLQFEASHPEINLLVFEHVCGSSISILSSRLRVLLPEPEPGGPRDTLRGTSLCQGHCRRLEDLEACDAECTNARDRKLIRIIQDMKRRGYHSKSAAM